MTSEPAIGTEQREQDRTRVSRMLEPHAPPDWQQRFRTTELLDSVIDGQPIQMFVMAADIRESTTLMKEAIRFERFALVMDKFVSSVRLGIRRSGGWFDKFTGDGFLAFWIVQSASPDEYEERPITTEDYASILLRFDGGARGALTVSQVSPGRKNQIDHATCSVVRVSISRSRPACRAFVTPAFVTPALVTRA